MINRICYVCNEYVTDSWTLQISDQREINMKYLVIFNCLNEIEEKYKNIKNVHKLSINQILKELNIK
jgi:hypothetical protein